MHRLAAIQLRGDGDRDHNLARAGALIDAALRDAGHDIVAIDAMLPAAHGDCLWIEYGSGTTVHRILIDGGPAHAYPALRERILHLPADERRFDAQRAHLGSLQQQRFASICNASEQDDQKRGQTRETGDYSGHGATREEAAAESILPRLMFP